MKTGATSLPPNTLEGFHKEVTRVAVQTTFHSYTMPRKKHRRLTYPSHNAPLDPERFTSPEWSLFIFRSVAVWSADSNLPVAWSSNLPSPVSCLACSPDLEEVAVGTVNTNEILFLKVHRRKQAGPASVAQEEG